MLDAPVLKAHMQARKDARDVKRLETPYGSLSDASADFPELQMLEDFLTGFLQGTSGSTQSSCQDAMQGIIYYAFQIVDNREIYKPDQVMKAYIAFQKLQEKQALFYA